MARKLKPSEEPAFATDIPFAEKIFETEGCYSRHFRRLMGAPFTDKQTFTALGEDAAPDKRAPQDEWF